MRVLAVTVSFHPDLEVLRRQVDALLGTDDAPGPVPLSTNPPSLRAQRGNPEIASPAARNDGEGRHCEAEGTPSSLRAPKGRGNLPSLPPRHCEAGGGQLSVLLVDNGSGPEALAVLRRWAAADRRVTLLELGENRGLAAAHNLGIAAAREQGYSHVLLMDQDSLPAPGMVAELARAFARLQQEDPRVAAVGPCYRDPALDNPPDFVRLHWWGIRRCTERPGHPTAAVDYLISSGCLISLQALETIGGMQEALFIDYVDIEWGLRARRLGWTLHGVFPARMSHSLGPRIVRFLWRRFPLHSPQRHYFVVRNALWLYRDGTLPLAWRLPHALRLLMRFTVYLLAGDARAERLKFVAMGIRDGLSGRMGKPSWLA